MGITPLVGMRVKLFFRGSGRWVESGGESAKFGLSNETKDYIWEIMDRSVDKHLSIPKKELERIESQLKQDAEGLYLLHHQAQWACQGQKKRTRLSSKLTHN